MRPFPPPACGVPGASAYHPYFTGAQVISQPMELHQVFTAVMADSSPRMLVFQYTHKVPPQTPQGTFTWRPIAQLALLAHHLGQVKRVRWRPSPDAPWGPQHGTWQWDQVSTLQVWFHYSGQEDHAYHHKYAATPQTDSSFLIGSWHGKNTPGRHFVSLGHPRVVSDLTAI